MSVNLCAAEINAARTADFARGRMHAIRWKTTGSLLLLTALGLTFADRGSADETDADGFAPLLSGSDLAGWVEEQHSFFRKQNPGVSTWSLHEGMLHADGSHGNAGFLRYDRKLCDFVLRLEYRMSAQCNSGVGLRSPVPYTTLEPNTLPSNLGYEFQIMDDAGKAPNDKSTGSFYAKLAPRENAAKPAGEWNRLEIECRGPRIVATLNGVEVQNIDHTQIPALADRPECGYLSLQNHGHDIDFRHVRLKELTAR